MSSWYKVHNEDHLMTPAMILFPSRIENNIKKMIQIAGDADRLRPHIKTHKLPAIIDMQLKHGVNKFKCATLAEMDLLARMGVSDILLAYPIVGASIKKFIMMQEEFPEINFSTLIDNLDSLQNIESIAVAHNQKVDLFIDINNGMNRTGIRPEYATSLYDKIQEKTCFNYRGLHIYDGHIHDSDFEIRKNHCDEAFKEAQEFIDELEDAGELICGGSVSFPVHALYKERNLSPGTCMLWDHKYKTLYPDMDFDYAAVMGTRIISKTTDSLMTLDAGHKALASEMSNARIHLFEIENFERKGHSEEHLVIESHKSAAYKVGDVIYGVPRHICPTMALHEYVYVAEEGAIVDKWHVAARSRMY